MTEPIAQAAPPTPLWWRGALGGVVVLLGLTAYAARDQLGPRGQAVFGVMCSLGLVAAFSLNLRAVNWRTVGFGFALQWLLALFILKLEFRGLEAIGIEGAFKPGYELFYAIAQAVNKFLEFPASGTALLFGKLVDDATMKRLFGENDYVIFAFAVLPGIIFVSSFFTALYYLGVLQWIVRVCARGMVYLLGTSGAETLSAIANVFMGQTEAPLIVKPYVITMTQSELLAMMVGGMATISGGLMATYIKMGADPVAILATSVMAAPCGLYLSKLLLPEMEEPQTRGIIKTDAEMPYRNLVDAAASGASDGLMLVLNVAAMLIAFMGLIAMINYLLGCVPTNQQFNDLGQWFDVRGGWHAVGNWLLTLLAFIPVWLVLRKAMARWSSASDPAAFGWQHAAVMVVAYAVFLTTVIGVMLFAPQQLSLNWVFSQFFAPVAFLIGVESNDVFIVADLLGTKLALNEFVAYIELTTKYKDSLRPRSAKLAAYALTGFANFASVGIQIGGIGALAPSRRSDLARLGMRALFVGFMATVLNAAMAGVLMDD
jgi:CNT family concentrative nucleoside transporter